MQPVHRKDGPLRRAGCLNHLANSCVGMDESAPTQHRQMKLIRTGAKRDQITRTSGFGSPDQREEACEMSPQAVFVAIPQSIVARDMIEWEAISAARQANTVEA